MKKLIVCLTLAAFTLLPTARAGDAKATDKTKAAAADKAKAGSTAKAAGAEKSACCADEAGGLAGKSCAGKSTCCGKETTARKVANPDQKGAMFLVKR